MLNCERPIENNNYRNEITWLSAVIDDRDQPLRETVAYLTGYKISSSGQIEAYNHTNSDELNIKVGLQAGDTSTVRSAIMKFFKGNYVAALYYLERLENSGQLTSGLSSAQLLKFYGVCSQQREF